MFNEIMSDPLYIMSSSLFENLKCVNGFTDMNGKTYMEHICIIFKEKLTENQKNVIMSKKNTDDALNYLSTIIYYTHVYV